nr:uncharacterized protein LOC109184184 [Ipomoea trifida]
MAKLPVPETLRRSSPATVDPLLPRSSAPLTAPALSSGRPSASEPIQVGNLGLVPLDNEDVRKHACLLIHSELGEISTLLTGRTKALREAMIKISSESYEYQIFRTSEVYAAAGLQAPDYTQKEKYIPKKAEVGTAVPHPVPGPSKKAMVLDKSFAAAPTGAKKIRKKVTLGSLKLTSGPSDSTEAPASTAIPSAVALTETLGANLQIARPLRRRGKEKAVDVEVETVSPLKRPRRPSPPGLTPILDALREGGEQTASLLEKIRTMVPCREDIRNVEIDQVGECIAQDILRLSHMTTDLFCRDTAAENVVRREIDPLKRSLSEKETENKELREKIVMLEDRVAKADREVSETKEKMTNHASLSAFLCRERSEAEAFFRAFLQNKIGEDLTWSYEKWAYSNGQHDMQQLATPRSRNL